MGILKAFFNNTGKPEGLLGRWMVGSMNYAHAAVSDWGMGHLPAAVLGEIAELGCGGGRNVGALLRRFPSARVTALDYSAISVERTRRINRQAVQGGGDAVWCREMFPGCPLKMRGSTWRPPLRRYISGPVRPKAFGRYTGS